MTDESPRTLEDLSEHLEQYPREAYRFMREGLSYAADQVHGPETEAHKELYDFLSSQRMDWSDLEISYRSGELPQQIAEAIEAAGGCDRLNRHVSGRQLCWALRDYALYRWGMLARNVLESWGITSTSDFGRIVFALIQLELMQGQPQDKIEDFDDVYSFDDAFEKVLPDRPDENLADC
jgi:uncharacterized repeat protein (TIGR04138 family)